MDFKKPNDEKHRDKKEETGNEIENNFQGKRANQPNSRSKSNEIYSPKSAVPGTSTVAESQINMEAYCT